MNKVRPSGWANRYAASVTVKHRWAPPKCLAYLLIIEPSVRLDGEGETITSRSLFKHWHFQSSVALSVPSMVHNNDSDAPVSDSPLPSTVEDITAECPQ
jgi:hypothetical protein